MKTYSITFGAVLLASLAGCRSEKTEIGALFTVTQPEVSTGSIAVKETVVKLAIPDDCDLNTISYVEGHGDVLLVSDRSNVYGFDREGNYLCQYGHKGQGPAEYTNMGACTFSPDGNVVICDSYTDKMLSYDAHDGSFSGETKLPVGSLKMTSQCGFVSGSEAILARYIFNSNDSVYATVNMTNLTVENFATAGVYTDNIAYPVGFHCFSIGDGRTAYLKPLDPVIYTAPDEKWIEIATEQKVLTAEQRAEIKDFSNISIFNCMENNTFTGYSDIYLMDGYLFLTLMGKDYAVINTATMEMKRYEYDNSQGIAKIIGCDREHNLLIGCNSSPWKVSDTIILYEIEP